MIQAVPTRVLVAGSGSIAVRHVGNLLALGVAEVVVVTARDLSANDAFSSPRIRVVDSIPADCPPVALVATDTSRHVSVARELVAAGAHVLVEKPIATRDPREAKLLAEEAAASGRCVRVAYNMRLLGAIRRIGESITAGVIGDVLFARIEAGQWLPDWRPDRDYRQSYSASASEGGVGLDLSHELDYMCALFGIPSSWKTLRARTGQLQIESEDVFEGLYSYSNGSIVSVHLDYLERVSRRMLRVVGAEGSIECDMIGRRLEVISAQGVSVKRDAELFDISETYVSEVTSFFDEIVGGPKVLPTIEDGLDVLRLLNDSPEVDHRV